MVGFQIDRRCGKWGQMTKSDLGKLRYDVISICGIFHLGRPYIYGPETVRVNKWVMNFYFHANNFLTPKIV